MGGNRFRRLRRMTDRIGTVHRASRDGAAGTLVSRLIILTRHPRPDVPGTIAKDNTAPAFVLSQETDSLTIGENQIRKVQNGDSTSRLGVDELAQFVQIVRAELTDDREHNRSASGAVNLQHGRG
jgi:hypothetical protein